MILAFASASLIRHIAHPLPISPALRGAFAPLPPPGSLLYDPYLAVSTGGTTGIPKCAVHTQFSYGATMINYMDRITLSGASVRITRELGLNDEQYGHLELFFGWAFAAGSLVFGFLADRVRIYFLSMDHNPDVPLTTQRVLNAFSNFGDDMVRDGRPWAVNTDPIRFAVEQSEPLHEECAHFLYAVSTGATPRTDSAEALSVLSVLDAASRSMKTGRHTVPRSPRARAEPGRFNGRKVQLVEPALVALD